MRAVIYTRSSAQNGESIESQEAVSRSWAVEHGHDVAGVYADDGVSGTTEALDRVGLANALTELEEKRAEILLVARGDRIARALHVQEAILDRAWQAGAQVFTVDNGEILKDDPSDPYRTFIRQVLGAASQLERSMIIARMQQGRRRKREAGYHVGGSRPYGYQVLENGKLEAIESEQAIIREIVELRKSETLRSVAATLNARNVLAPSGGKWQAKQIQRIEKRGK
jgi:DNA invertase Pin-like site-specific DNA recombinase